MSIDVRMDEVRELDQRGEREAALILVKDLMSKYPGEAALWSLEGSLYARNKSYDKAISSLDEAIVISPQQGIFYFQRGRYNMKTGNVLEAINDFSDALSKDNYDDITFTRELYFFRAEAFIQLGKKHEALSDLSHIPDDYQTWTFKLRSKNDLIVDCNAL